LANEVAALFGILNSLHLVAVRFKGQDFDSTMEANHLRSCHVLLERIQGILIKAQPVSSEGPLKGALKLMKWSLSKRTRKALILDVERNKSTLSLA